MSKALTRVDLVSILMTKLNFDKKEAAEFVKSFYDELVHAFTQGESVHLSGFGNFDVKQKKARVVRNPKTKETHVISPRQVVSFHASQKLKLALKRKKNARTSTAY